MKWRSLSIVLLFAMTGCPAEDTAETDDDSSTSEGSDVGDTDGTDDEGTEGTDDEGTDDVGTDTPLPSCYPLDAAAGEWAGDINDPSLVTDVPYTFDADLSAVRAAAAAVIDGPVAVDLDVTGAIITTLNFNRDIDEDPPEVRRFWVGDSSGGLKVFLDNSDEGWDLSAGDEVTFTVSSVNLVNGTPEIDGISEMTVVSQGNPIYVKPGNGVALDVANDIGVVHMLYGELDDGSSDCTGSNTCFELETRMGDETSVSIVSLRNDRLQTALVEGDCVQVQAPLESSNGEPQFNIGNLQWQRWLRNIND